MVSKAVIDTILGEAGGKTRAERYSDMLAIASVIANRAELANTTPESIVSAKGQFGAYGKSLPDGTEDLRDLAESAWSYVEQNGPVNNATYYSKPSSRDNLPGDLKQESATVAHEYFSDPKGRSFRTADGYVTPATAAQPAIVSPDLIAPQNPYSSLVPPQTVPSAAIPSDRPAFASQAPAPPRSVPGELYAGPGMMAVGNYVARGPENVDAKLTDIINTAAVGFPYDVRAISGYRPGDSRQHGKGHAIDVELVDPRTGKALPNYQNAQSFRAYEQFAQRAREVQQSKYPELGSSFRWGGYFGGPKGKYGAADLMHFDVGGRPGFGMRGGSWEYGLTDAQRANFPGAESRGFMSLPDATWSEGIPTPTPRPDTLAAPVGPVTRAPLPDLASPAMGARAAAGLQGMDQPAFGARAASELQSYKGTPQAMPTTPAPTPTPAPALNAPRSITDRPVAAPPVPSIVNPPTGMSRPSLPAAVPPTSVTTSAVPLASIGSFPEAPMDPGRKARTEAAKGALLGLATGGLPGAILGGLLGPARAQIGRNIASRRNPFSNIFSSYRGMFGDLGRFSNIPAPNYSATPYSVGSGYGAIGSVFGAPAGATAVSRSNPEVSFTSLGNGYVSRSNSQYGTSYTMGPGEYDAGMFSGGGKSGGKGGKK